MVAADEYGGRDPDVWMQTKCFLGIRLDRNATVCASAEKFDGSGICQ